MKPKFARALLANQDPRVVGKNLELQIESTIVVTVASAFVKSVQINLCPSRSSICKNLSVFVILAFSCFLEPWICVKSPRKEKCQTNLLKIKESGLIKVAATETMPLSTVAEVQIHMKTAARQAQLDNTDPNQLLEYLDLVAKVEMLVETLNLSKEVQEQVVLRKMLAKDRVLPPLGPKVQAEMKLRKVVVRKHVSKIHSLTVQAMQPHFHLAPEEHFLLHQVANDQDRTAMGLDVIHHPHGQNLVTAAQTPLEAVAVAIWAEWGQGPSPLQGIEERPTRMPLQVVYHSRKALDLRGPGSRIKVHAPHGPILRLA